MLGVSTYAYVWRRHRDLAARMSLDDVLHDARQHGLGVVQLCDDEEVEHPDPARLQHLRDTAERLGLTLETGTKGVEPEHLRRHLQTARLLGSRLVRSMLSSTRGRPDVDDAVRALRVSMPAFERHGVTLALETYEQYRTEDLIRVVREVGSPALGICLDPGNSVAALENPRDVVAATAPHVANVHVKDFAFSRSEGMIGFRLEGERLGRGLLDHQHMVDCLASAGVQANQIVEHWMPRRGTLPDTAAAEAAWVEHSVAWLRSRPGLPSPSR